MKTYIVQIREVHISHREVEAESAKEALEQAGFLQGEETFREYSHALDPRLWTVQEKGSNELIDGEDLI